GPPAIKGETPAAQTLGLVQGILAADPSPGKKYVLFVTDGEPDFCDDGSPVCPIDAAIGAVQSLYTAGVATFVFGVASNLTTAQDKTLQELANAGANQGVLTPDDISVPIYTQCNIIAAWKNLLQASGKPLDPASTLGAYSATGGTAMVYRPNPLEQQALTD